MPQAPALVYHAVASRDVRRALTHAREANNLPTPNGIATGVLYARFPVAKMDGGALPARRLTPIDADAGQRYSDPNLATIAPYVDVAWYNTMYPDVASAGLDPVEHYAHFGWKEGRWPHAAFDPAWYVDAYHDIGEAGIEPLRHYVMAGFAEGRLPLRPGNAERSIIETARRMADHVPTSSALKDAPRLSVHRLRQAIAAASVGANGFVLSLSHDRYIDITGGIQLVIADEQRLFTTARFTYLHASPEVPALTLRPDSGVPMMLQLVLDGIFLGLVSSDDLREALAAHAPRLPGQTVFVVHSFFGHRPSDLVSYANAMAARTRIVWLHDYGALCEGFNLLRNGVEYCGAPPPDSHACMVCLHGAERVAYLRRVRQLFAGLNPILAAPSNSAMALFEARSDLPHLRRVVHPNAALVLEPPQPSARPALGTAEDPVRVAFAGYRLGHKGWHSFMRLVEVMEGNEAYRFFHFAAPEALGTMHGIAGVAAQATPNDRLAMRDALARERIDLVMVLSPWPETFSFVTYEAFAAGADVISLVVGGNAAAAVRLNGRGVVLQDEFTMLQFFTSGAALAYAREMVAAGRQGGTLRLVGTSATLNPEGETGQPAELAETEEPRLRVLAGKAVLAPAAVDGRLVFTLPAGAGTVRLISRHDLEGRGVCIGEIRLDGEIVPLDDARLGPGWHAPAAAARLTRGDAVLEVGDASRLELTLRLGLRYPRLPLDAG